MAESAHNLTVDNAEVIAQWCKGIVVEEIDPDGNRFPGINVQCGIYVKRASLGDWVVLLDNGDFDVMGPNRFTQWLLE